MLIYNTLSGQKEDLNKVLNGKKKIRLFVCGPTVYDEPHLGHARIAVFFDFVKRYLEHLGYKVKYLQNITDVDDKIIDRAGHEKKTPEEIAKLYEKEYLDAMKLLGIKSVDKYPRASAHIKQIISQIKTLWDKGFAYKTASGVYFEVRKFPEYGKLSKQNLEELRPGWRIEPDSEKKDPLDFALWKSNPDAKGSGLRPERRRKHEYEPSWKSPWGKGRPGWHIEDTAITGKYFGPQYDLHGGGMDLKFPHHESEIAQQEAASGKKPFVKLWMHVGFVNIGGEKMSKSLKNFITIQDFLKDHSANLLRFITLSHDYRSPLNYTSNLVNQSQAALDGIAQFLGKLSMTGKVNNSLSNLGLTPKFKECERWFWGALKDDFTTPEALAGIFELIAYINPKIWELNKKSAKSVKKWLIEKLNLFGIELKMPKIPLKIKFFARKRELSRRSKQYAKSDALRKEIETLGYTVEDTPRGPFVWPRE